MKHADISSRMQFFANHAAQRGVNLLAGHCLVKRLTNSVWLFCKSLLTLMSPETEGQNVPIEARRSRRAQTGSFAFTLAISYLSATASNALGFDRAIVSKVRAAPLGCLRPCSQP